MRKNKRQGFTLIELSIVLVIIGLIVGGMLVGQDLIEAAAIRAQISQLEKFSTSVNTFRTKYNYIPGDLPSSQASALGFVTRTGGIGDGDGDGKIGWLNIDSDSVDVALGGETVTFWTDLSSAQLISGSFTQASTLTPSTPAPDFTQYFPQAKLGSKNSFVIACNPSESYGKHPPQPGLYFIITQPTSGFEINNQDVLSTMEAYAIDTKTDDGLPFTGSVVSETPGIYGSGSGIASMSIGDQGNFSTRCVTSTATYNVTFPGTPNCSLMVKAQ